MTKNLQKLLDNPQYDQGWSGYFSNLTNPYSRGSAHWKSFEDGYEDARQHQARCMNNASD